MDRALDEIVAERQVSCHDFEHIKSGAGADLLHREVVVGDRAVEDVVADAGLSAQSIPVTA